MRVQEQQGRNNELVVTRNQQTSYELVYGVDAIGNKYYKQSSLKRSLPHVIKTKKGMKIPKNIKRSNLPSDYVQSADD